MSRRFGRLSRAGAALVAAVVLVTAARELPRSLRAEDGLLTENAGRSRLQRELAPALAFGLNPSLVLLAEQRLPPDAVFYVATGPGLAPGGDAAGPFAAYWLLPRRHTDDIEQAQWILGFGVDPATLGVPVEVVEDVGNGDRLLRVRQ